MKYLGSKNRIAKYILPIMLKYRTKGMHWYEPFVGGANMIDKVENPRFGNDSNEYLVSLLNQMSKPNWKSPKISEEIYNEIKEYKGQFPRWVVGYAGTQLSFGATWFGSYRRDSKGVRDYSKEAQRNVDKQSKNIQGVKFTNFNYYDMPINTDKAIIYCDPPYDTKATKGKYKDDFDHVRFWDWCREMSDRGHTVFVSEYKAPDDFVCVWQKDISQKMNNSVKTSGATEKLFVLTSNE